MSDKLTLARRSRIACALALAVIVAWAFAARIGSVTGPFGFGWQSLGAFYSRMARNLVEYGPLHARFAMIENAQPTTPDRWVVYTHHPPGLALTTAALMAVLGDGPLAIKSLGVAFALLQVLVTYALVAEALSRRAGLAAAFATAVLPAGAYYSTHGSELGPEAVALALLALLLDERARAKEPAQTGRGGAFAALVGSIFFAWPGLIVAGFIALRDLLGRRFWRALAFGAVIPAAFALHWAHMAIATAPVVPSPATARQSLFESLAAHSALGAADLLRNFSVAQVQARLMGHLRFLFGLPVLVLAFGGGMLGLAKARRWAPEGAPAQRAWTTLAALAIFALLYSAPLFGAVIVHRYWLLVALPLVAFLIGAAVHTTAVRPLAGAAWIVAAVAGGAWTTCDVVEQQRRDRTPYFEEFGAVLRANVPADRIVLSTANDVDNITYYSRREIRGRFDDRALAQALLAGNVAEATLPAYFALVEPPVDLSDAPHAKVAAFLAKSWPSQRFRLEKTGADVVLFDLSRRLAR